MPSTLSITENPKDRGQDRFSIRNSYFSDLEIRNNGVVAKSKRDCLFAPFLGSHVTFLKDDFISVVSGVNRLSPKPTHKTPPDAAAKPRKPRD